MLRKYIFIVLFALLLVGLVDAGITAKNNKFEVNQTSVLQDTLSLNETNAWDTRIGTVNFFVVKEGVVKSTSSTTIGECTSADGDCSHKKKTVSDGSTADITYIAKPDGDVKFAINFTAGADGHYHIYYQLGNFTDFGYYTAYDNAAKFVFEDGEGIMYNWTDINLTGFTSTAAISNGIFTHDIELGDLNAGEELYLDPYIGSSVGVNAFAGGFGGWSQVVRNSTGGCDMLVYHSTTGIVLFSSINCSSGALDGGWVNTTIDGSSDFRYPSLYVLSNDTKIIVYQNLTGYPDHIGTIINHPNTGVWTKTNEQYTLTNLTADRPVSCAVSSSDSLFCIGSNSSSVQTSIFAFNYTSSGWSSGVETGLSIAGSDGVLERKAMCIDSKDNLHIVYVNATNGNTYYLNRSVAGVWYNKGVVLSDGLNRQPECQTDMRDIVHVVVSENTVPTNNRGIFYINSSNNWGTPYTAKKTITAPSANASNAHIIFNESIMHIIYLETNRTNSAVTTIRDNVSNNYGKTFGASYSNIILNELKTFSASSSSEWLNSRYAKYPDFMNYSTLGVIEFVFGNETTAGGNNQLWFFNSSLSLAPYTNTAPTVSAVTVSPSSVNSTATTVSFNFTITDTDGASEITSCGIVGTRSGSNFYSAGTLWTAIGNNVNCSASSTFAATGGMDVRGWGYDGTDNSSSAQAAADYASTTLGAAAVISNASINMTVSRQLVVANTGTNSSAFSYTYAFTLPTGVNMWWVIDAADADCYDGANLTQGNTDAASWTATAGAGATTTDTLCWREQITTRLSQTPSDITSLNAIGNANGGVLITYETNESTPTAAYLQYKVNSTFRDHWGIINGTNISSYSGWQNNTGITVSIIGNNTNFTLDDNHVYPFVASRDPDDFEDMAHNYNVQINNSNSYLKMEIYNMSGYYNYSYLEIMTNNSLSTQDPISVYYCNSSYTTGSPLTSAGCVSVGQFINPNTWNHSHMLAYNYSSHSVLPLNINATNGSINGVKITDVSAFLIRGRTGTNNVKIYGLTNGSRTNTTMITTNAGTAWTAIPSVTMDMHVHQFNGTGSLYYYPCFVIAGTQVCTSTIRSDVLDLANLPPAGLSVTYPTEAYYNGIINITYTEAGSENAYAISYYKVDLVNSDLTLNKSLVANNSLNLYYYWNTTTTTNGTYRVRVTVYDNISQSSIAYSQNFTLWKAPNASATIYATNSTNRSDSILVYGNCTDTYGGTNTTSCGFYGTRGGAAYGVAGYVSLIAGDLHQCSANVSFAAKGGMSLATWCSSDVNSSLSTPVVNATRADTTESATSQITNLAFTTNSTGNNVWFRRSLTIANDGTDSHFFNMSYSLNLSTGTNDLWWVIPSNDVTCTAANLTSGTGASTTFYANASAGETNVMTLCWLYKNAVNFTVGAFNIGTPANLTLQNLTVPLSITESVGEATTFSYDIRGIMNPYNAGSFIATDNESLNAAGLNANGWAGVNGYFWGNWIQYLTLPTNMSMNRTELDYITYNTTLLPVNASYSINSTFIASLGALNASFYPSLGGYVYYCYDDAACGNSTMLSFTQQENKSVQIYYSVPLNVSNSTNVLGSPWHPANFRRYWNINTSAARSINGVAIQFPNEVGNDFLFTCAGLPAACDTAVQASWQPDAFSFTDALLLRTGENASSTNFMQMWDGTVAVLGGGGGGGYSPPLTLPTQAQNASIVPVELPPLENIPQLESIGDFISAVDAWLKGFTQGIPNWAFALAIFAILLFIDLRKNKIATTGILSVLGSMIIVALYVIPK